MAEATDSGSPLLSLSQALATLVARIAPSLVRVDDGSRLTGSGIVWSDGLVISTSHGVERDEEISVVGFDGVRRAATLIGRDHDTDIALLKTDTSGLATIALAESGESPAVGSLAIAVGRPGDFGLTATLGVVSGVQETQTGGAPEFIVTTDAVLYPGVSGGALVGADGVLIGLLNRMYGNIAGVALGVPLISRVAASLATHGRVPRGYLGVRTQRVALPDSLRVANSLAQTHGLLVVSVEPGSGADLAGIGLGDTLVGLDGVPLTDIDALRGSLTVGKEFAVDLLRGGALTRATGTVGAAPA